MRLLLLSSVPLYIRRNTFQGHVCLREVVPSVDPHPITYEYRVLDLAISVVRNSTYICDCGLILAYIKRNN